MTKDKAIAIRRVSSKKQMENNHSLEQQDDSVQNMATVLSAEIIKDWGMAISGKKGNNLERKDLQEALNFCRYNRGVKYLLIDKVNRFMRELKMIFYFMVEFEKLGVKVVFCDPSQQKLNADTAEGSYEIARKGYEAEAENEERSLTSFTKMKARVALGYYPFYPHQGYKKTEAADGLHVPDQPRFSLLQKALKSTASLEMTPKEAQLWLASNGYRTPVIYRKDKDGNKIRKALLKAWKNQRGSNMEQVKALNRRKDQLDQQLEETTAKYVNAETAILESMLSKRIETLTQDIKQIETDVYGLENTDLESDSFVAWAFDYVTDMQDRWWSLSPANRTRGAEILFNSKIYINRDAFVHSPTLSSIYRLGSNKKALSNLDNAHLEEHLEKSSPLIIDEIRRWRDLLWDDYLDYKYREKRS